MARRISVPSGAMNPIGLIAEHSDKLHHLEAIIEELDAGKRSPPTIARKFSDKAKISFSAARLIVMQLMAFQEIRANYKMGAADFFASITDSLKSEAEPEWQEKYLEKWQTGKEFLEKFLAPNNPLGIAHKSLRLSYEHPNIIYDSRIITDIRPVFDDDARDLKQMLISHTLEIEYSDGSEQRQFFVALGTDDLRALTEACERAQAKEATLKDKMGELWPAPISRSSFYVSPNGF